MKLAGLALPLIVAALMENNYVDGAVMIPGVLRDYAGMEKINK